MVGILVADICPSAPYNVQEKYTFLENERIANVLWRLQVPEDTNGSVLDTNSTLKVGALIPPSNT